MPVTQAIFRAIVHASAGDYTTVQAAIDDIPTAGATLYVRQGTYAGFSCTRNNFQMKIESGTVFTSAIEFSGIHSWCEWNGNTSCAFPVTLSGTGNCIVGSGEGTIGNLIISGNKCYFHGYCQVFRLNNAANNNEGLKITGNDNIVIGAFSHMTEVGSAINSVHVEGVRNVLWRIISQGSDQYGFYLGGSGFHNILDCYSVTPDDDCFRIDSPKCILSGCYGSTLDSTSTSAAYRFTANADNCILNDSVSTNIPASGYTVRLEAGATNNVVAGCRLLGGAPSDAGTGNLIVNNNTAA